MFARLWWKEGRQAWPVWAFLACVGLALQGLVRILAGEGQEEGYVLIAGLVAAIYLFLIAAAIFAGEREGGTLGLLDALPVDRLRLWGAKASFALATTLGLGLLLWLSSAAYMGLVPDLFRITGAALTWGVVALGWGLLWSAVLGTAMPAAVLAMASLGATLAAFVNLQDGPTTERAPLLIVIGLAAAAASAFAFVRTGPPRWEPRRGRPEPGTDRAAEEVAPAGDRRPERSWTYSVGRLAWETLRQVRAEIPILLAIALGAWAFSHHVEGSHRGLRQSLIITSAIVSLMAGIATFNGENRGRTHRFLDQHGVRPGLAWAVKVAIWWSTMVALGVLVQVPSLPWMLTSGQGPALRDLASLAPAVLGVVSFPFALGALSGMVFRRGITAGSIAVVSLIVLGGLLAALTALGLMGMSAFLYPAPALLAVTWAWSGDWLRYRPGFGKWARLAAWCVAAVTILVPGYVGGRVWDVPTIPTGQASMLFDPGRFDRPTPPEADAAPLYREAEEELMEAGGLAAADAGPGSPRPLDPGMLESLRGERLTAPDVVDWLRKVEPTLATIRKASLLPNCDYEDPRRATIFTPAREPFHAALTTSLAVSARARLARGDLLGSWDEVETLLRMARQYSQVRGWTYFFIEPIAVGLAMEWAADPGQTPESLERALDSYRALPPGFTPADRARLDRNAFQNTTRLPRDELIDQYLRMYGPRKRVDTSSALQAELLTTPWEMARARKVYDLLSASWIQMLGDKPYADLSLEPGTGSLGWRSIPLDTRRMLMLGESGGSLTPLGPAELTSLAATTPIVRLDEPGREAARYPRIEAERRALALVLRLRLYQARHDGSLPNALDELPPPQEEGSPVADLELLDPYAGVRFGFLPSSGQPLIPLADMIRAGEYRSRDHAPLKPSDGCRLLYSVGPDLRDDRAARNLDNMHIGDLVYPLKDGVKPPAAGTP